LGGSWATPSTRCAASGCWCRGAPKSLLSTMQGRAEVRAQRGRRERDCRAKARVGGGRDKRLRVAARVARRSPPGRTASAQVCLYRKLRRACLPGSAARAGTSPGRALSVAPAAQSLPQRMASAGHCRAAVPATPCFPPEPTTRRHRIALRQSNSHAGRPTRLTWCLSDEPEPAPH
jgi:hypothetical protein